MYCRSLPYRTFIRCLPHSYICIFSFFLWSEALLHKLQHYKLQSDCCSFHCIIQQQPSYFKRQLHSTLYYASCTCNRCTGTQLHNQKALNIENDGNGFCYLFPFFIKIYLNLQFCINNHLNIIIMYNFEFL